MLLKHLGRELSKQSSSWWSRELQGAVLVVSWQGRAASPADGRQGAPPVPPQHPCRPWQRPQQSNKTETSKWWWRWRASCLPSAGPTHLVSTLVKPRWDLDMVGSLPGCMSQRCQGGPPLQGFGHPEGSLRDSTDMIVRMVQFSLL